MPITGTRQFLINGPCLVKVKGRGTLFDLIDPDFTDEPENLRYSELGLTSEQVTISYISHHKDVIVDDFGPTVPAEVLVQLAEMRINMSLIHYDPYILQACLSESMGGSLDVIINDGDTNFMPRPERMFSANKPLGGGMPALRPGCHYIELYLTSPYLLTPWMFPTAYIINETKIPIGTDRTIANLVWRSIPYKSQYIVSGVISVSGSFSQLTPQEINASGTLIFDRYNQNLYLQMFNNPPSGTNLSGEIING